MDDEAAYMALVTSNSQGELSPLEIGMHALHCVGLSKGGSGKKGGLSAYAEKVGRDNKTVRQCRDGARVAEKVGVDPHLLQDKTQHLAAIHALPETCWQPAVAVLGHLAKAGGSSNIYHVRQVASGQLATSMLIASISTMLRRPQRLAHGGLPSRPC